MQVLIFPLVLLLSCTSPSFVKGDCIQKPDSPFIWEVLSINGDEMSITNLTTKEEIAKLEKVSSDWLKTSCPQ